MAPNRTTLDADSARRATFPAPDVPKPRASARPAAGGAAILAMQRAVGNRAAASMAKGSTSLVSASAVPLPGGGRESAPESEAVPTPERPRVQRWDPLGNLVDGVKERVLGPLADRARAMPGYGLLCTVLGRDPITGVRAPRNATAVINGVLDLIPGSDRIRGPLTESGAIPRAGQWLDEEIPKLGLDFETIKVLMASGLKAVDPLHPIDSLGKLIGIFTEPVARLKNFAIGAGKKLMEFVIEGAMTLAGGAGSTVMGIIKRAGGAFDKIISNPVGFVGNLVNAVKGGFNGFLGNIWTHLKSGLFGWLTGSLGAAIRMPKKFDLQGILGFALNILGMGWHTVKDKLGKVIGHDTVDKLQNATSTVQKYTGAAGDILTRGIPAVTERIGDFVGGIVETVIDGIKDWAARTVVGQAITKILSMLNPAGAIVQAVIATYNTVMFVVERAKQLASLGSAIFDSLEAIAGGAIGAAIGAVESALSRGVPVVLGFLSRLIGLGDIAGPVRTVIDTVRGKIDGALDKVVGFIAKAAGPAIRVVKGLAGKVKGGIDRIKAGARGLADRGKAAVKRGAAGVKNLAERTARGAEDLFGVRKPFEAAGETHTIYNTNGSTTLTVASTPTDVGTHPDPQVRAAYELYRSAVDAANKRGKKRAAARHLPALTAALQHWFSKPGSGDAGRHASNGSTMLVGKVGPYRELKGLQDPDKSTKPALRLYAEHVIPRHLIDALSRLLGGGGAASQGGQYEAMQTVLMYNSAKPLKDSRDPRPSKVDSDARAMRASVASEPDATRMADELQSRAVSYLSAARKAGEQAALDAVHGDSPGDAQRRTKDRRPMDDEIRQAGQAQFDYAHDLLDAAQLAGTMGSNDNPVSLIAREVSASHQVGWMEGEYPDAFQIVPLGLRGGASSSVGRLTYGANRWHLTSHGQSVGGPIIRGSDVASRRTIQEIRVAIEEARVVEAKRRSDRRSGSGNVADAVAAAELLMTSPGATQESVKKELPALRVQHGLESAHLVLDETAETSRIAVQRVTGVTASHPLPGTYDHTTTDSMRDPDNREHEHAVRIRKIALQTLASSGPDGPVKVVPLSYNIKPTVRGDFTKAKAVVGRTPAQLARELGVVAFGLGVRVYRLARSEITEATLNLRGYTQSPGGKHPNQSTPENLAKWPVGQGSPQWNLGAEVSAHHVGDFKPGEVVRL